MANITIKDGLTPAIKSLAARLRDTERLMRGVAVEGAEFWKRHWLALNGSRPNRRGFKRSNFWKRHGRDVVRIAEVSGNRVRLVVGDGQMAWQRHGGTMRPLPPKKSLAIPARKGAGYSPSTHPEAATLHFVPARSPGKLRGFLVSSARTKLGRRKKDGTYGKGRELVGVVYYWLVAFVKKGPDTSVEPSDYGPLRERIRKLGENLFRG